MSNETKAAVKAAPRNNTRNQINYKVRFTAVTAMLGAIAFILMYLEIAVPFIPTFIKYDVSDMPALLGAFMYGPACGVIICLIKNVLHMMASNSMFVGELSNFILGVVLVIPAGLIHKYKKTKTSALVGGIVGAVLMGIVCIFSNYFVVYPVYYKVAMPEDVILSMYQAILPSMKSILQSLIVFNMPFTIIKGIIATVVAMVFYVPISLIRDELGNR